MGVVVAGCRLLRSVGGGVLSDSDVLVGSNGADLDRRIIRVLALVLLLLLPAIVEDLENAEGTRENDKKGYYDAHDKEDAKGLLAGLLVRE